MKNKIIFFTGAGVSAESGISTFRDSNGLWENHDIQTVCNIRTWEQNKGLVFKFYNERRVKLKDVEPNLIHKKIAELQNKYGKDRIIILTQNVDDLFERAGCEEVIHLHGFLPEMMCLDCDNVWNIGYGETNSNTFCPKCKSTHIKPHIIFFGENAPSYQTFHIKINEIMKNDIFVVMGTMGNVIPINQYANAVRSYNILNNLEESPYICSENFDDVFYMKGTEAILQIEKIIKKKIN
jgi:NAD-dependent deacetylase